MFVPQPFAGPGEFALDNASLRIEYKPRISAVNPSPTSPNEGVAMTITAVASDPAGDTLTYVWTWGDGTPNGSGVSPSHTYADNGAHTITLTVNDGFGGSSVATVPITVKNVPPVITAMPVPATADEGSSVAVSATATDVPTDPLTYSWSWGDGSPDSAPDAASVASHVYADNGTYNVVLTATDDDGGVRTKTKVITVDNVAPTIISAPPTTATQDAPYTYLPESEDPGADTVVWTAPTAPAGATIDPGSGAVAWTPTYAQALARTADFDLVVTDDDGGATHQRFSVAVAWIDSDGDGMPDVWETDHGLNPTSAADANQDPDADGLANAEEFALDQDPHVFDGPSAPAIAWPGAGEDIADTSPSLVVTNAVDPQSDALTYEFELYDDASLNSLVASDGGITEDPNTTAWMVPAELDENARYWWRARANDGAVDSAWSEVSEFRVNTVNEPPTTPVAVYPVDEAVSDRTPQLEWVDSTDPYDEVIMYDVEVWDAGQTTRITSIDDIPGGEVNGTWTVDVDLPDGAYTWRVYAIDPQGLASPWRDSAFQVVTDQLPPEGVAFTAPVDGARIEPLSPTLVASEGADPEGNAITYRFEVDAVATFDSAQYVATEVSGNGDGTASWDLAAHGVVLPENATAYARVRGIDPFDHASAPDTIAFYVIGVNEPPTGLQLRSPLPASQLTAPEPLVCGLTVDPEGTAVTYEFLVASDEGLTAILDQSGPIQGGTTDASWTPTAALDGAIYWSARAVDADGVASAWATPFAFAIHSGDTGTTTPAGNCGCADAGPSAGAWPLLLGLLALRRRRRS